METTAVKCDKCGYEVPIPSRAGDACTVGLPGGGYCNGTMQPVTAVAPPAVARQPGGRCPRLRGFGRS